MHLSEKSTCARQLGCCAVPNLKAWMPELDVCSNSRPEVLSRPCGCRVWGVYSLTCKIGVLLAPLPAQPHANHHQDVYVEVESRSGPVRRSVTQAKAHHRYLMALIASLASFVAHPPERDSFDDVVQRSKNVIPLLHFSRSTVTLGTSFIQ